MPTRPAIPCIMPGCGHVQPCPSHARRHLSDQLRGGSSARGLGARQRRWRLIILARDPLCRGCQRELSAHADHIIPRKGVEDWSEENGQGLCAACHSYKTAVEQRDPFFGLRLREEGAKLGQPAPVAWRELKAFGGEQ